ncbi:MAG: hypothetical protein RBS77_03395 [Candidatus Moranbacteria bacterium]|jgi:hypothetical protein|nr:hypothetical protein [Candidatus Moranbacteria bacterium]
MGKENIDIIKSAYFVLADYDLEIENILQTEKFAWAFDGRFKLEDYLNTKIFPPTKRGKAFVNIEFIPILDLESFHWSGMTVSVKEVLSELDKLGYRAVEIRELLAFGNAFFHLQTKKPIIAFGSVGVTDGKVEIVAGICCRDMKATIIIVCPEENCFDSKCCLAVVKK